MEETNEGSANTQESDRTESEIDNIPSVEPVGEITLTKAGRRELGNLIDLKDVSVAEAIRLRGGGQSQVQQIARDYQQMSVGAIANLAAESDTKAKTAMKIIKGASKYRQKYAGK